MFEKIKTSIQKDIVLAIKDIISLNHLHHLYDNYLPWTGASIRPTALKSFLNDVLINDRSVIVECGAGISTVYVAALLKQIGDSSKRIYSIDHDKNWLEVLHRELKSKSLDGFVELIHAPLTQSELCLNDNYTWYDTSILNKAVPANIDFLFIDGPPAKQKGMEYARYPALPFFADKITDSFTVMIDDADRKGEAYLTKKWQELHGVTFKKRILDGNIFIGTEGTAYNIY